MKLAMLQTKPAKHAKDKSSAGNMGSFVKAKVTRRLGSCVDNDNLMSKLGATQNLMILREREEERRRMIKKASQQD